MSNTATIDVQVPATTANIGPGFDCLGAALTRYNRFRFIKRRDGTTQPSPQIRVQGLEAERVTTNASNLVYKSFVYYFQQQQQPVPDIEIEINLGVPLSRGLGSSATAIVAGLMGANAISGQPLTKQQLLPMAIALEGHPDNVAPALLGGCQLSAKAQSGEEWITCKLDWASEIIPIVAIPSFELSTKTARNVLPQSCSYDTAIFNAAHLGLLVKGLERGKADLLRAALFDWLHQPHLLPLIEGAEEVFQAANAAGAYGVVISGAGPTLLALGPPEAADAIAAAMKSAWSNQAETAILDIDDEGATFHPT